VINYWGPSLPLPFPPPLPLPSLALLSIPLPFPFSSLPPLSSPSLPFPPLTGRTPEIQLGVWESAVSSPSGVWGGAPDEIEFGAL